MGATNLVLCDSGLDECNLNGADVDGDVNCYDASYGGPPPSPGPGCVTSYCPGPGGGMVWNEGNTGNIEWQAGYAGYQIQISAFIPGAVNSFISNSEFAYNFWSVGGKLMLLNFNSGDIEDVDSPYSSSLDGILDLLMPVEVAPNSPPPNLVAGPGAAPPGANSCKSLWGNKGIDYACGYRCDGPGGGGSVLIPVWKIQAACPPARSGCPSYLDVTYNVWFEDPFFHYRLGNTNVVENSCIYGKVQ